MNLSAARKTYSDVERGTVSPVQTMGCETFLPPPHIVLVVGKVPRQCDKKKKNAFYYPKAVISCSHLWKLKEGWFHCSLKMMMKQVYKGNGTYPLSGSNSRV